MKVRVNLNYGKRKISTRQLASPIERSNNRKKTAHTGSPRRNKATVRDSRIQEAFRSARGQQAKVQRHESSAGAGVSRRMYLNQTASRYPRAAELAD